jgi:hypothetical protein
VGTLTKQIENGIFLHIHLIGIVHYLGTAVSTINKSYNKASAEVEITSLKVDSSRFIPYSIKDKAAYKRSGSLEINKRSDIETSSYQHEFGCTLDSMGIIYYWAIK